MLDDTLKRTEDYLTKKLLPFWVSRIAEPRYGGFQTNYDRDGKRTAVTEKTLLCQARTLFTLSHALRAGHSWQGAEQMLLDGILFLDRHFHDKATGGYHWIVEEDGTPTDTRKVIYGHSFLIYGFAEHALLTGDNQSRQEACRLFDLLCASSADLLHGGFFEHFNDDFELEAVRPDGLVHKSLDVHMHLMEAFTALLELTGSSRHRQALDQVTELIFKHMVDPKTGVGIAMFTPDWTPISNAQLGTLWGSDRFETEGKPPCITSYGHNIELAWLYLHSLRIRGIPPESALSRVTPIFDHTLRLGVDWEFGGLFVDGHREEMATETTKEFWQQAEALVGFLDAYALTGEDRYLEAFSNVHDFVFQRMINWDQGEWFPLLAREGDVMWDYMGHNWKTCYHTIRAMCEVVTRLHALLD